MSNYIILDIETTGLDPEKDKIIEVGAVCIDSSLNIIYEYHSLINPQVLIPYEITILTHGLSNELIKDAPVFDDIKNDLLNFIGDLPIIAHNASFEASYLKQYLNPHMKNIFMDSLAFITLFFPAFKSMKLDTLIRFLDIRKNGEVHRALEDAKDLLSVLIHIKNKIQVDKHWYLVAKRLSDYFYNSDWLWGDFCKNIIPPIMPLESEKNKTNIDIVHTDVEFEIEPKDIEADVLISLIKEPLESRSEQNKYIKKVSECFNNNLSAMIEAGTGTGKTLGYLLPGIKWAIYNKKPLIVSTKTKTLQQQIIEKDIPLVKNILNINQLKAVKVQGRNNYLCIKKMEKILADIDLWDDFESKYAKLFFFCLDRLSDIADVTQIPSWLRRENKTIFKMLNVICADAASCLKAKCIHYKDCHYFNMIRSASKAEVLIVNHSLVLNWPAHLQRGERIIFDEAHNLEKEASSASVTVVGTQSLDDLLDILYESNHNRGLVFALKKQNIELSILNNIIELIDAIKDIEVDLQIDVKELFYSTFSKIGKKPSKEWAEDVIVYSPTMLFGAYDLVKTNEWKKVLNSLCEISARLKAISACITELDKKSLKETEYPLLLLSLQEKLSEKISFLDDISNFSSDNLNNDKFVYWATWDEKKSFWSVSRAFIDVGSLLADQVYIEYMSAIFTSATLNAGKISLSNNIGFSKIQGKILSDKTISINSPFDYKNNSALCFLNNTSAPWENSFVYDLSFFVESVASLLKGKTLILFSSIKRMNACYSLLIEKLEPKGFQILKQGYGSDVVDNFVNSSKSILLGSESFGEGLDIRGKNLSCVILERMPIVMKDPVYTAREDLFKMQTKISPYTGFEIPQRLLKLRQWAGRLIRSKTDKGFVIVYDNWFCKQNDHIKTMLAEAMQPMPVAISSQKEILNWIKKRYTEWSYL